MFSSEFQFYLLRGKILEMKLPFPIWSNVILLLEKINGNESLETLPMCGVKEVALTFTPMYILHSKPSIICG